MIFCNIQNPLSSQVCHVLTQKGSADLDECTEKWLTGTGCNEHS